MLIPRFTIRSLLVLTTIAAFVCFIIALAVRGEDWAIALSTSVVSLALAFVVYGFFFVMAFVLARIFGMVKSPKATAGTPFATAAPPPQIIPPTDDLE